MANTLSSAQTFPHKVYSIMALLRVLTSFPAMVIMVVDEVLGFRPDFIEHQLAHAVRDPNGRAYNPRVYLPERPNIMPVRVD